MLASILFAIASSGQDFASGYPPHPTVAALAPDGALAIGCKNGTILTINENGLDDVFHAGFWPQMLAFSRSGRYLAVDESPPDDPHRLFVYDRDHNRTIAIVSPNRSIDTATTAAFTEDEKCVYFWAVIDTDDKPKNLFKFVDLEESLIRNVTLWAETELAMRLILSPEPRRPKVVLERIDDRKAMSVSFSGKSVHRMKPTDSLWYQEFTLVNDRLLVTHSSRGIEFIDVQQSKRLLYAKIHERRQATVTFYTPSGQYWVDSVMLLLKEDDRSISPEFPASLKLNWKRDDRAVGRALSTALSIAKDGWETSSPH